MIPGVPYDEELEYIESTGSQYIDTGLVTSSAWSNYTVDAHFMPVSATASSSMAAFGATYWGMGGPGNGRWWDFNEVMEAGRKYHLHLEKDIRSRVRVYLDGVQKYTSTSSTWVSSYFGIKIGIFGFGDGGSNRGKWRCYGIRFYIDNELAHDYIPVRVGTTALMYDRVTRTFPAHYGTFVAGPVVARPVMGLHFYPWVYTARDYIQDGLVAMWDGIENAGWGQHEESPHSPVNLIDGQSLSINGDVEIGSNYFKFGAGKWGYSTISDFASAVASKSFTVEIVAKNDKVSNAGIVSIGSRGVWLYADSSNNIQTLNILSSTYTPSPSIQFKSSDVWHATIQGGTTPQIIVNDRTISAQYGTQTSVSSSVFYIGSLQGNSSWSNGNMWCSSVRLYSRNLTASEIAHNYNIDKWRFNLP